MTRPRPGPAAGRPGRAPDRLPAQRLRRGRQPVGGRAGDRHRHPDGHRHPAVHTVRAVHVARQQPGRGRAQRRGGPRYDLGTIVDVTSSGGTPVIVLDRWTVTGTPDSEVAANGVPIRVHADAPYENQNARTTFRVPVAPEATFTYHHCVSVDQPMQSRSVTLQQLAALDRSEGVILLRLDDRGRVTRADNDPAC